MPIDNLFAHSTVHSDNFYLIRIVTREYIHQLIYSYITQSVKLIGIGMEVSNSLIGKTKE